MSVAIDLGRSVYLPFVVEKFVGFDLQRLRQRENYVDRYIEGLTFDTREIAAVDAGAFGELALRESGSVTQPTNIFRQGTAGSTLDLQTFGGNSTIVSTVTSITNIHGRNSLAELVANPTTRATKCAGMRLVGTGALSSVRYRRRSGPDDRTIEAIWKL